MNTQIEQLEPCEVWAQFKKITHVPRPSGHEEAIRNFLIHTAQEIGVEALRDEAGNIILRKAASPGMESCKGVILQAHMDMVPQKNRDKRFDFVQDPIQAYVDGEWVTADGTTLGADDGIGIAAILAVMASKTLKHGPLEALITSSEETGMEGARLLKGGLLQGEILLNLDSESEGELCVGCAGGLDLTATLNYTTEPAAGAWSPLHLELKGLKGGHSGVEIHLGRGNANLLLARFLKMALEQYGVRLVAMDGGGLRNAIPREASAVILVPTSQVAAFQEAVKQYHATLTEEYQGIEEGIVLHATPCELPQAMMTEASAERIINTLYGCPNGVYTMSPSMAGMVQTSTNLSRIITHEGEAQIFCLLRSSITSEKLALSAKIDAVCRLGGAKVETSGGYDGWNPNMNSPILHTMVASYQTLFGKAPIVGAIHAGLECGIISTNYPSLDMISFGPTICHPHSPDEKVNIASVARFWHYLTDTLSHIPVK
ncbi:MAG: aminoacyl-histidine dipeptidase [Alistipes sp.]|nr:aminoacyl-histidine dipeptidase [Alistipes sp.]